METKVKRRSGRPKKAEADKAKYQRIAVYEQDYSLLVEKIRKRNSKAKGKRIKLTDAFKEMVEGYPEK